MQKWQTLFDIQWFNSCWLLADSFWLMANG